MHVQMLVPGPFVCSRKAVWWLPLIQKWKQYMNMHPFALLYIVQQEVFPRESCKGCQAQFLAKLFLCYFFAACFVPFFGCIFHLLCRFESDTWVLCHTLVRICPLVPHLQTVWYRDLFEPPIAGMRAVMAQRSLSDFVTKKCKTSSR